MCIYITHLPIYKYMCVYMYVHIDIYVESYNYRENV